jgi:hypothetical protein
MVQPHQCQHLRVPPRPLREASVRHSRFTVRREASHRPYDDRAKAKEGQVKSKDWSNPKIHFPPDKEAKRKMGRH